MIYLLLINILWLLFAIKVSSFADPARRGDPRGGGPFDYAQGEW